MHLLINSNLLLSIIVQPSIVYIWNIKYTTFAFKLKKLSEGKYKDLPFWI